MLFLLTIQLELHSSPLVQMLRNCDAIVLVQVTSVRHFAPLPVCGYGVSVTEVLHGTISDVSEVRRTPGDSSGGRRPLLREGDTGVLFLNRQGDLWNVYGADAEGEMLVMGGTVYATVPLSDTLTPFTALDGRAYDYFADLADLKAAVRDFYLMFRTDPCRSGLHRLELLVSVSELDGAIERSQVHAHLVKWAKQKVGAIGRSWKAGYDEACEAYRAGQRSRALKSAWSAYERAEQLGDCHPFRAKSLELLVAIYGDSEADAIWSSRLRSFIAATTQPSKQ